MCKAVLQRSCQCVKCWLYVKASHQILPGQTDFANILPWAFIKICIWICFSQTIIPLISVFSEHSHSYLQQTTSLYTFQPCVGQYFHIRTFMFIGETWSSSWGQETYAIVSADQLHQGNLFPLANLFKIMQWDVNYSRISSMLFFFCTVWRM